MEMGSLARYTNSQKRILQTKGCKSFPREFLYIRWVNDKCQKFQEMFWERKNTEDIFSSKEAEKLSKIFKDFLQVKNKCKFQNFSNLNLRLSSVEGFFELKECLYSLINSNRTDFHIEDDDDFRDFFETFIVFTHRTFIKVTEDYENDIYYVSESEISSDSESDLIEFSSDSD